MSLPVAPHSSTFLALHGSSSLQNVCNLFAVVQVIVRSARPPRLGFGLIGIPAIHVWAAAVPTSKHKAWTRILFLWTLRSLFMKFSPKSKKCSWLNNEFKTVTDRESRLALYRGENCQSLTTTEQCLNSVKIRHANIITFRNFSLNYSALYSTHENVTYSCHLPVIKNILPKKISLVYTRIWWERVRLHILQTS